jgi:hypothetical protein
MATPPEMIVITIPAVQKRKISNLPGGRMVGLASFTMPAQPKPEGDRLRARRIGNAGPISAEWPHWREPLT